MRRIRSVRLGKEGIDRLVLAMESKRRLDSPGQRLTRDQKGAMLGGLSVATVDKLLQGRVVDRATAELAFRAVGLSLSNEDIVPGTDTQLEDERSGPDQLAEIGKPRSRKALLTVAVVSTVAVAWVAQVAIVGMGGKDVNRNDMSFWYGTWRLKSMNIGKQTTPCPGEITHDGITTPCEAETWTLNPDGTAVINGEKGKWHTKNGEFSLFLKGVGHGFTVSRADTYFILRYDVPWQTWSEFYFFERAEPQSEGASR